MNRIRMAGVYAALLTLAACAAQDAGDIKGVYISERHPGVRLQVTQTTIVRAPAGDVYDYTIEDGQLIVRSALEGASGRVAPDSLVFSTGKVFLGAWTRWDSTALRRSVIDDVTEFQKAQVAFYKDHKRFASAEELAAGTPRWTPKQEPGVEKKLSVQATNGSYTVTLAGSSRRERSEVSCSSTGYAPGLKLLQFSQEPQGPPAEIHCSLTLDGEITGFKTAGFDGGFSPVIVTPDRRQLAMHKALDGLNEKQGHFYVMSGRFGTLEELRAPPYSWAAAEGVTARITAAKDGYSAVLTDSEGSCGMYLGGVPSPHAQVTRQGDTACW